MTPRELERLEKDSIFTLRLNDDLKDQVINRYLDEFMKKVKVNLKKKEVVLLMYEMDD